jgi:Spy/CpxP family protein refolding chaperone
MKLTIPATKQMRAAALALCVFSIAATPIWAQATQDAPPPPQADGSAPPPHARGEHMQERHLEMMTKQLNLTPDQVTQVKAIDQDGMTQMKALHEDSSLAPADKHAKMKAIHEAQTAKIRAILTDDQKPKFDKMIAHQQERMEHRDGPGDDRNQPPPPPPPAA